MDLKEPPCPDGNGLYAVGCSQKYLECVNNVEYVQSCPEGLFFDRLLSRCERRANNKMSQFSLPTDRKKYEQISIEMRPNLQRS